ncbi:MAG: 4-vinyl reductase [Ardenticatenia bacterium]|nr:4-vinyl reductase [Ardenticatenia bacterium]
MSAENRSMPNAALYVLFRAIEEVMGEKGFRAMLNASGLQAYISNPPPNNLDHDITFEDYARLQQAVEDFYGPRGARAILAQIGRVTFRYTLEQQPAILGLAGLALKLLPEQAKVKMILTRMQNASNERVNMTAHMDEDDEAWYFVVTACPCVFRERSSSNPACYTTAGTIQEALRWATGNHYMVREIKCMNLGEGECCFRIDKTPQS